VTATLCVACDGSLQHEPWLHTPAIALHRCIVCQSLTALPRPSADAQSALHDSDAYFTHPYFQRRRQEDARTRARARETFARISPALNGRSVRGARHLDIGCDTGLFARTMAAELATVPVGIDVATRAIERARAEGMEAYCTTIEHVPAALGTFRLITAIDLIEHVADPVTLLAAVRPHLAADGVCYIETPNLESLIYTIGRVTAGTIARRSAAVARLFPREHIQYFSERGLRATAQRAGLTVTRSGTRVLPAADLGVSTPIAAALTLLQFADRIAHREIIRWAVLHHA
jgi:2-polyprenyl-3-methyl-5-hydroxy-6-metoxy-1,4-benzoquinol methylase